MDSAALRPTRRQPSHPAPPRTHLCRLPSPSSASLRIPPPSSAALQLKAIGVHDVHSFEFIESPSADALRQALCTLLSLGALTRKDGTITGPCILAAGAGGRAEGE